MNLFAVAALAVIGAVFLSGRPRLIRPALIAFTVLCLADWVLIEDLGFFGGLGTDPNSMIPMALLAIAGYLALTRAPQRAAAQASAGAIPRQAGGTGSGSRPRPGRLAAASIRIVASAGAVGVIILGAAPMAAAQASPVADTILAQAIDGSSNPVNYRAPAFSLTNQHGQAVTLASLRGKVVLLTFLDPVCTSDCPLDRAGVPPGRPAAERGLPHVELVAVNRQPPRLPSWAIPGPSTARSAWRACRTGCT